MAKINGKRLLAFGLAERVCHLTFEHNKECWSSDHSRSFRVRARVEATYSPIESRVAAPEITRYYVRARVRVPGPPLVRPPILYLAAL